MRILCLSGGGAKGYFQLPILEQLQFEHWDLVLGVSIGANNGAFFCQGDLLGARWFWENLNDKLALNGVKGFITPSVWRGRGLFSLSPLEKKLKENISLDRLKIPFGAGVVIRETHQYHNLLSANMTGDAQLHNAILASSAISFLMEPYAVDQQGVEGTGCDGGHIHVCPIPPVGATHITAVLNFPINPAARPADKVDGLCESALWSFEKFMEATQKRDLEILTDLAKSGVATRVYAPDQHLGGIMDASQKLGKIREAAGYRALKKPLWLSSTR